MSRQSNPEGDDEKEEEAKGKEGRAWRECGLFLVYEVSDPIEPIKSIQIASPPGPFHIHVILSMVEQCVRQCVKDNTRPRL